MEVRLARDQYPPTVDFPEYTKTITENERPNGNALVRIQARDQDLKGKLTYEVVGDLAAPSYFRVDQQGNVFVRNSLKDDISDEYTVSFMHQLFSHFCETLRIIKTINLILYHVPHKCACINLEK